ncbi:MAG: nitronate monooxygenase family protein [Candidatus Lokiarchaeia archaeon]|nr:nitronate monooxygenase family protein [Candidatus Lokiarchaeia archaeon]
MGLETTITKMFGIKHPIVAAPMGPFYTTELTIAVSEAGGLGVLSHSALLSDYMKGRNPVDIMKENMLKVVEHTDKPFGFNIRTSRRETYTPQFVKDIPKFIMENQRVKEQCVYAVTSAGSSRTLPQSQSFQKLKESGSNIKHFHVAPALWLADKCITSNVEGLVVTGGEGGGHQSYEKVSTLVLLQQIMKKYPNFPVIACGGFASGEGLAAALSMGAGAIAMGSRFIASKESEFSDTYKETVPPAKAQDTLLVTGALGPIRLWKNEYSLHHGLVADKEAKMAQEAAMSQEDIIAEGKAYEAAYTGDINSGAVLLGQSIGVINSLESVNKIIEDIVREAENRLKNAYSLIK